MTMTRMSEDLHRHLSACARGGEISLLYLPFCCYSFGFLHLTAFFFVHLIFEVLFGANSSAVEPVAVLLSLSAMLAVAVCNCMTSLLQQGGILPLSQLDFYYHIIILSQQTDIIVNGIVWCTFTQIGNACHLKSPLIAGGRRTLWAPFCMSFMRCKIHHVVPPGLLQNPS